MLRYCSNSKEYYPVYLQASSLFPIIYNSGATLSLLSSDKPFRQVSRALTSLIQRIGSKIYLSAPGFHKTGVLDARGRRDMKRGFD